MAVFGMIVVADAVEIGGHNAPVVGTILAVVAFTEFDACNFSDCVRLWLPQAYRSNRALSLMGCGACLG